MRSISRTEIFCVGGINVSVSACLEPTVEVWIPDIEHALASTLAYKSFSLPVKEIFACWLLQKAYSQAGLSCTFEMYPQIFMDALNLPHHELFCWRFPGIFRIIILFQYPLQELSEFIGIYFDPFLLLLVKKCSSFWNSAPIYSKHTF